MRQNYALMALNEYAINETQTSQIADLLDECFPGFFDGRTWFKQIPHFRYLGFKDEALIAHMGVDHRLIKVGRVVVRIFGLIDLCVKPECRGCGIGSSLLQAAEELAGRSNVDFLVLMGDDDSLYKSNGFEHVSPAPTRWLAVENAESVTVMEKDLAECFLMKAVKSKAWPKGTIDMVGYLF